MSKFDLLKLQNNYFEATKANANVANEVIGKAQNWLLTLATTELVFVGTLLVDSQHIDSVLGWYLLWVAGCLLLVNFIFFFLGAYFQFQHFRRVARRYNGLSHKTWEHIKNHGVEVEEIPPELQDLKENMQTSREANISFLLSFICIGGSTVALAILFTDMIF
jgi:cytochrome c biogenesis factor